MFDFFKKKNPPASKPYVPWCLVGAEGLGKYQIEFNISDADPQVEEVVNKLLQTMVEMKISNDVAMQVPAALHTALAESYEWCIAKTIYKPLSYNGDDQSDEGDNKGED